jgi:hypothetical protein
VLRRSGRPQLFQPRTIRLPIGFRQSFVQINSGVEQVRGNICSARRGENRRSREAAGMKKAREDRLF